MKATHAPLTVLFSFLSRADSTPLGLRSRADGHVLGVDGNPLQDPAADASENAFESDPNLNFEKWGEYWRKVHGMRFIHPESSADDTIIAGLLRYDQIHRVAGGPTSLNPPPYLPPLDAAGNLFDTVIGHIEPYRRPEWDGVAYLNFANLDDLNRLLASDRVRQKILPEDRAIFRDLAPFLARQYILLPSKAGADAVILVRSHIRRGDRDRSDFQTRWLRDHSKAVLNQPATQQLVKRYVQLHNIGPDVKGQPFFHEATSRIDAITIIAFASMMDAEAFLTSDDYARIEASEDSLSIVESAKYWTGLNFRVIDRLSGEARTAFP